MTKLAVVGLLFGVFQTSIQTTPPPGKPVSVCEVLHNLAAYRGKMVEVRGSWYGDELQAPACAALSLSGYPWETSLQLKFPNKEGRYSENKVPDWDFELETFERFFKQVEGAQTGRFDNLVMATFTGRVDAPVDHILFDGRAMGVGTQGRYPAVLIMKDIKDIKIINTN
jgi:hypothetical protein